MIPALAALFILAAQDADLLREAEARILRLRTGEAALRVGDGGRPAAGVRVRASQVSHEFLFGANLFGWREDGAAASQAAYRGRFQELFNYATLPFYWSSYETEPGRTAERRLRAMAAWCAERRIAAKGHPLFWHECFPGWVSGEPPLEALMQRRADELVGGFRGLVDRWDVINEALAAPRFTNVYGAWVKDMGAVEAAARCLRWAQRANEGGTFVVNDYNVGEAFAKQLRVLKEAGAPVHAAGVQSHMHAAEWSPRKTWDVCESLGRAGLPLHFTEVSILSGPKEASMKDWHTRRPAWASTPEEEERQALLADRFYTLLFSHPSVEAITWWDLSDEGAWMGAPAGLLRKDMTPKPAYERLRARIRGDWWTREVSGETGADGGLTLRGFKGEYAGTATLPDGRERAFRFRVPGGPFRIEF